jgi:hypothetical protein
LRYDSCHRAYNPFDFKKIKSYQEQKMNNDDQTIRLMLGYLCIAKEVEASLVRKVEILDRFDLADEEIATICNCSTQSVRNARLTVKKGAHAKGKKK